MKKYNKTIAIHYKYANSLGSESALAEVFDDIFMRLLRRQQRELYTNFDPFTAVVFGLALEYKKLYIDN